MKADNSAKIAKSEAEVAERKALEARTLASVPTGSSATDALRKDQANVEAVKAETK